MNPRDVLNKWLAKKGSKIERSMPIVFRENVEFRADFDFILQSVIYRNGGKFRFAQIGANDGVSSSDDIANYIEHFDAERIMGLYLLYEILNFFREIASEVKIQALGNSRKSSKKMI